MSVSISLCCVDHKKRIYVKDSGKVVWSDQGDLELLSEFLDEHRSCELRQAACTTGCVQGTSDSTDDYELLSVKSMLQVNPSSPIFANEIDWSKILAANQ